MCVYVIEYIEVPVLSTLLNLFVPELFDCVLLISSKRRDKCDSYMTSISVPLEEVMDTSITGQTYEYRLKSIENQITPTSAYVRVCIECGRGDACGVRQLLYIIESY